MSEVPFLLRATVQRFIWKHGDRDLICQAWFNPESLRSTLTPGVLEGRTMWNCTKLWPKRPDIWPFNSHVNKCLKMASRSERADVILGWKLVPLMWVFVSWLSGSL